MATDLLGVGVTCSGVQCCALVTKFLTGCGVGGVSIPLLGVGVTECTACVACVVCVVWAVTGTCLGVAWAASGRLAYQAPTDTLLRVELTTNGCSRSFAYFGLWR